MSPALYRAEFEVISGPMDGQEFLLSSRIIRLGRMPGCEICIPRDKKLEPEKHLTIYLESDGVWHLRNDSGLPVSLDGEEVDSLAEISDGQVIKAGDSELLVRCLRAESALWGEAGQEEEEEKGRPDVSEDDREYLQRLERTRGHLSVSGEAAKELLARLGGIIKKEEKAFFNLLKSEVTSRGLEGVGLAGMVGAAMGTDREPSALSVLYEMLEGYPDEPVRLKAGRLLFSAAGESPVGLEQAIVDGVVEKLSQQLLVEDERTRVTCTWAIFKLKGDDAFDLCSLALMHQDPDVRRETARFFGFLRNGRAVPHLVEALDRERYAKVRSTILWALGYIGDPIACEVLTRALREDDDEEARGYAAWALGETGVAEAEDALQAAAKDRSGEVRAWAARALLKLRASGRPEGRPDDNKPAP